MPENPITNTAPVPKQKVRLTFKGLWQILKATGADFADCGITRMSAALAYYTVFSIAPMLILVISLSAIFYGKSAIEGNIYDEIREFVGSAAAQQIQDLIKHATIARNSNVFASGASILALILGATSVFGEIQDSINLVWGLKAKPKRGWFKIVLNRLLSFSIIVSLSFILLVSLIASALLDVLVNRLIQLFPGMAVYIAYAVNLLLTLIIITFLFAVIFKVLPDAKIKWRDVITGAVTTAILFMVGKFAIGFYLGTKNIGNMYGAAGSIIIILLWVYYSAIILYFGAAFTKQYARYKGRHIFPNDYAVWRENVQTESAGALHVLPKDK